MLTFDLSIQMGCQVIFTRRILQQNLNCLQASILDLSAKMEWTDRRTVLLHNTSLPLEGGPSLHFNGHFPGEPLLAGFTAAKDDGSDGDS